MVRNLASDLATMPKRFLTTLPDGRLAVIQINGDDPDGTKLAKTMFELSRDGSDMLTHFDPVVHTLAVVSAGLPGHIALTCRECDESDLPAEQALRGREPTFRDAWEDTGTVIQVNLPKARIIHMDRIRKVRDAELAKLDVLYLMALEAGDAAEQQRIATLKQQLRDIPQTFDLSQFSTAATLKSAWPAELPNPVVSQVEP